MGRFSRDSKSRPLILEALSFIAEPSTAGRLVNAIDQLTYPEYSVWRATSASMEQVLQRLLQGSRDCDALDLLLRSAVAASTTRALAERCQDLRARLEAIRDAPLPAEQTAERQRLSERGVIARQILAVLNSPPVPATPQSVVQRVIPLPEATGLGSYVATIQTGRAYDTAFYQAVSGITRFGTPDTFNELRQAFESGSDLVRSRTGVAMAAMTFHGNYRNTPMAAPAFWNQWWKQNRGRSREQWAKEVLSRRQPLVESREWNMGEWAAAEYIVSLHRGSAAIVEELRTHRSFRARLGAANALVEFDRQQAGRLMLRELQNRYLEACTAAGAALAELTGQWHPFQCHEMEGRMRVIELWTRDVKLLPSGPTRIGR